MTEATGPNQNPFYLINSIKDSLVSAKAISSDYVRMGILWSAYFQDAILIGNDFGSQTGLMVSREAIKEFVLPGTKRLIDQAKNYGLVVMHHSCGSVFPIIGDLIEPGAEIIHPANIEVMFKAIHKNSIQ